MSLCSYLRVSGLSSPDVVGPLSSLRSTSPPSLLTTTPDQSLPSARLPPRRVSVGPSLSSWLESHRSRPSVQSVPPSLVVQFMTTSDSFYFWLLTRNLNRFTFNNHSPFDKVTSPTLLSLRSGLPKFSLSPYLSLWWPLFPFPLFITEVCR